MNVEVTYAAYHEDGSNQVVTIEKPAGYHPEATYVAELAARAAVVKNPGSPCIRVCRTSVIAMADGPPCLVDHTIWEGRIERKS